MLLKIGDLIATAQLRCSPCLTHLLPIGDRYLEKLNCHCALDGASWATSPAQYDDWNGYA